LKNKPNHSEEIDLKKSEIKAMCLMSDSIGFNKIGGIIEGFCEVDN